MDMENSAAFAGFGEIWERVTRGKGTIPGSAELFPRERNKSFALRRTWGCDQSFSLPGLMPKVSQKARWKAE